MHLNAAVLCSSPRWHLTNIRKTGSLPTLLVALITPSDTSVSKKGEKRLHEIISVAGYEPNSRKNRKRKFCLGWTPSTSLCALWRGVWPALLICTLLYGIFQSHFGYVGFLPQEVYSVVESKAAKYANWIKANDCFQFLFIFSLSPLTSLHLATATLHMASDHFIYFEHFMASINHAE